MMGGGRTPVRVEVETGRGGSGGEEGEVLKREVEGKEGDASG